MNYFTRYLLFLVLLSIAACSPFSSKKNTADVVIAFGSCNKQYVKNELWEPILQNKPNLWIWGGDNIYADTNDPAVMKAQYEVQLQQQAYQEFKKTVPMMATWDDHDYGLNDGGADFEMKDTFQQLFFDFLELPKNDPRRARPGVYDAQLYTTPKGSIHVIVLDTRYFRTSLTRATEGNKRYQPNTYGTGTILGEAQWNWLEEQLKTPADFTVIVSSIQFLSQEHGFETWGNFPHEVDKLITLLAKTKVKNTLLLSGDRHISEFSRLNTPKLNYPLIDFTSSGLTHTYTGVNTEQNRYRIQNLVNEKSFGLLHFSFEEAKITLQMRGLNNKLIQEHIQVYP